MARLNICSEDGTPMCSIERISPRSKRIARSRSWPGANGCARRCQRHSNQTRASREANTAEPAALAAPSRGRPAQPRISSGVHNSPTTVASSSACNGVFASPTARLTAVASHSRKKAGAPSNNTRA
ncbi:hypothetical protein G6F50_017389 [Rhizopus delemar]|uniref:Uncharacterized protein n=1 Tax=Rhizopus delemar TaxID=936053 RepID=A0A9P7C088_9FUNG|nr:hypothetical protein G6F50_017389 [Rhizopus delemar]